MDCTLDIKSTLQRIRTENDTLQAFVQIAPDPTTPIPPSSPQRPFGGLAIAIKDLIDTADFPTAYGSCIYQGHQPKADAAIVAELKRLGAVVVGKTATTEFATSSPTATRNPRRLT